MTQMIGTRTMAKRIEATDISAFYGSFKAIDSINMMIERVDSGCCKNACLPHSSSENLTILSCAFNEIFVRNQQRSHGTTQSFR